MNITGALAGQEPAAARKAAGAGGVHAGEDWGREDESAAPCGNAPQGLPPQGTRPCFSLLLCKDPNAGTAETTRGALGAER